MRRATIIIVGLLLLVACGGETVEVTRLIEVTRVVEEISEVTVVVEQEVTRMVEVTREVIVTPTATNTPEPTNTPQPTSTPERSAMGAADNPIPFNFVISINVNGDDFEISVTEVIRGEDAWQRILTANQFNDPAPEGMEWALIKVAIDNTDQSNTLELDRQAFLIVTGGRVLSFFDIVSYLPCCLDNQLADLTLLPNGSTEVWIPRPVNVDDNNPLLLIGSASSGVYFELQ